MKAKKMDYSIEKKTTQIGKLGMLTTSIIKYNDGVSELSQALTFIGQNGNIHEITSASGNMLFGTSNDLVELETLVEWIAEHSIRNN